jgi:hypothetical protein
MNSLARTAALIGFILFILVTIWSVYWAIALQREGCLVTMKIVAHTKVKGETDDKDTVLVHRVLAYKDGREEESMFESDYLSAPKVGTLMHFYLFTGPIEYSYEVKILSDWHYAWLPPILSFFTTCAFTGLWWAIIKYNSIPYYKLIIIILTLSLVGSIYINPIKRIFNIREYILDQRKYSSTEKL